MLFAHLIPCLISCFLAFPGFFPALDGTSRGNFGLMDQVAALHWIQENIEKFGGDTNNVTIFGQGHGGAMVNLLTLSPMARGKTSGKKTMLISCKEQNVAEMMVSTWTLHSRWTSKRQYGPYPPSTLTAPIP